MSVAVAAAVFPVVFLGELPDKTMFASLVLASKGRAGAVWLGAALAFAVHVAIAVTAGVVLFDLLPHRLLEAIVAGSFLVAAGYSFHLRNEEGEMANVRAPRSPARTAATAAGVIFVAEWGDLTQILTANLAARYHSAPSVALGALLALWTAAGIAIAAGNGLLRVLPVRTLRVCTAIVLVGLGLYSLVAVVA